MMSGSYLRCRSIIGSIISCSCTIMDVQSKPLQELGENVDKVTVIKKARMSEPSCVPVPVLRFAKLTENATKPTRGSAQAAGFDLYSAYDYVIPAHGKLLARTDIQIEVPEGCYGRVAPRSGLANKHFIDVGAGVIDQDYRGNVGVILFNFGNEDFTDFE